MEIFGGVSACEGWDEDTSKGEPRIDFALSIKSCCICKVRSYEFHTTDSFRNVFTCG